MKWNSPFYGIEGRGWFLSFHVYTDYIKVAFFRGASLMPLPPGTSKNKDVRYLNLGVGDEFDEAQIRTWVKDPVAYRIEYADGLKATMLLMNGLVGDITFAARIRGDDASTEYGGHGACYLEFGGDQVARVDVTFMSGQPPTGTFEPPSHALAADKAEFGSSRIQRWFGTTWRATEHAEG